MGIDSIKEKAVAAKEIISEHANKLAASAGDFVENRIGERIEGSPLEAPILEGEPYEMIWYKLPISGAYAGDGSDFHIYVKKGRSENLCIYFSGGGVAWNEKMASLPVTGGRVAAWKPNYYWNNLRPFTQVMNINVGITDNRDINPFYDWNFAVITYATGDFHLGSNVYSYSDDEGEAQKICFVGHDNFRLSMDRVKELFPTPTKLLISGESAGAFAAPALAPEVIDDYYPDCEEITLFSDSALLKRAGWKETIENMWHAPKAISDVVYTDNITADWYEHISKKYGDRVKCLYASSTHDYLLSAFINEERSGEYFTDEATQNEYAASLADMCERMAGFSHNMHFFIYNYRMPLIFGRGGTIHTAVRSPHFFIPNTGGITMADWLFDAVGGNMYDVGTELV